MAHELIDVVGWAELPWTPPTDVVLLAVGGSRRRDTAADRDQVLLAVVDRVERARDRPVVLVSGGCAQGADRSAELVAAAMGLTMIRFLPEPAPKGSARWVHTALLHARNSRVVGLGHDLLAQVAADRTGGTEDAVRKAHALGKTVTLLLPDGAIVVESPPVSKRRSRGVPLMTGDTRR